MYLTSVKLRRFERGLMQMEVAKRAQIPWGRLSEIESGRAQPEADELERIAVVLGVPSKRLLSTPSVR